MQTLIFTPSGPGHEMKLRVGPGYVKTSGPGPIEVLPEQVEVLLRDYPSNFRAPEGKKAESGPSTNKAEPPPGKNKKFFHRRKAGD